MDKKIEIEFVKKCIKETYQERILFELQSKKHREKAILRFSHSSENILKNNFVKSNISNMQSILSKKTLEKCYIISDALYDGEMLEFNDAVEYCKEAYMPVILISPQFVVIKEEVEKKETTLWVCLFD